jgi:hypothetical protein
VCHGSYVSHVNQRERAGTCSERCIFNLGATMVPTRLNKRTKMVLFPSVLDADAHPLFMSRLSPEHNQRGAPSQLVNNANSHQGRLRALHNDYHHKCDIRRVISQISMAIGARTHQCRRMKCRCQSCRRGLGRGFRRRKTSL